MNGTALLEEYCSQNIKTAKSKHRTVLPYKVDPITIIKSFNTWAYKREQPSEPDRLLDVVARAVEIGVPLEFVLYWGKGPRSHIAAADLQCLDYISAMFQRIQSSYIAGVKATIILTDTHAEHNGHAALSIALYFKAVTAAASERGIATVRLKELINRATTLQAGALPMPQAETLERLQQCAAKWYRGEGSSMEGAAQYYRMNMGEKQAVGNAFPDATFITFNGSEFRDLFPEHMPIFYMYSMRKGTSVKPWFIGVDRPGCATPNDCV